MKIKHLLSALLLVLAVCMPTTARAQQQTSVGDRAACFVHGKVKSVWAEEWGYTIRFDRNGYEVTAAKPKTKYRKSRAGRQQLVRYNHAASDAYFENIYEDGRLVQRATIGGSTTYTYDAKGRVVRTETRYEEGGEEVVAYTYDAKGNVVKAESYSCEEPGTAKDHHERTYRIEKVDRHGNWIVRTTGGQRETRRIAYYE